MEQVLSGRVLTQERSEGDSQKPPRPPNWGHSSHLAHVFAGGHYIVGGKTPWPVWIWPKKPPKQEPSTTGSCAPR